MEVGLSLETAIRMPTEMRWKTLTVRGMSLLENLENVVMAMNSAQLVDMALQPHLRLTLIALWLAHLHILTHSLIMSLLALVGLAPTHNLTTSLHVLAAVIDIVWLLRWSNDQWRTRHTIGYVVTVMATFYKVLTR